MSDILERGARIEAEARFLQDLVAEVERVVLGQRRLVERLVIALLTDSHVLIEGVPGLAKTLVISSLAKAMDLSFHRIQFTPDLLPSDVTGTQIYNPAQGTFSVRKGPVFANLVLADEINRAPAKVQSALLEAMQERQVTIGDETHALPRPFFVMATQNPLEQQGTYPLPEAQLDRFSVRMAIGYPPLPEEARMLVEQTTESPLETLRPVAGAEDVHRAIGAARGVFVEETVNRYVVALLRHTRANARLALGGSPRAGIALVRVAKARALAERRDYVLPEDIQSVAEPVLAHRLILAPEARSTGITAADAVREAVASTPAPV